MWLVRELEPNRKVPSVHPPSIFKVHWWWLLVRFGKSEPAPTNRPYKIDGVWIWNSALLRSFPGVRLWTNYISTSAYIYLPSSHQVFHLLSNLHSDNHLRALQTHLMSIPSTAQYVALYNEFGWRKVKTCSFGSAQWFWPRIFVQLAKAGKRYSKA